MIFTNKLYIEDIEYTAGLNLNWGKIRGKSFLISGASGLIGSFLIDVLMYKDPGCRIHALVRNSERASKIFSGYPNITITSHDINYPLDEISGSYNFVLHMASNTHPRSYSADPVGTITANVIGLNNMLKFAAEHNAERFMFASSVEVYGENRGDTEYFNEDYCGNIDISKARAGYPESKRCGETLCQSYIQQYGLDVVIPRFSRTYGPNMLMSDSKAISQFILKGIAGEDIILKSQGTQMYSYSYAADAVSGLLTVLAEGLNGNAYNIADEGSDITLKELAGLIADYSGRKVLFELPDELERKGYSLASKAVLDSSKLKGLGWSAHYDIKTGIRRTLDILSAETSR